MREQARRLTELVLRARGSRLAARSSARARLLALSIGGSERALTSAAPLFCSKHPREMNLTTVACSGSLRSSGSSKPTPLKNSNTLRAMTEDLRPSFSRISSGAMRSSAMSVSLNDWELDCLEMDMVAGLTASSVTMQTSRERFSAIAHTMWCPAAGGAVVELSSTLTDAGRLLGKTTELSVPWRAGDTGGTVGMTENPAPREVALGFSVLSFRDGGGREGGGTSRCLRLARLACQSAGAAGEVWGRASDMAG